jgi:FkbM family methyltransferase
MIQSLITNFKNRFCPLNQRKSYALNELDVKLEPYLRQRGGFFIEAGGNDGLTQSNTLYFEKYLGWRGLLIEAIPALAEKCRNNRPRCAVENCALVASSYAEPTIEMHYRNLMSIVKGGIPDASAESDYLALGESCMLRNDTPCTLTVPAKTLGRILDERHIKRIDLLSLDVEGYEAQVLEGIDFDQHRPIHLLIEVHDRQIIETLISKWYHPVAVLSQNSLHSDILYRSITP